MNSTRLRTFFLTFILIASANFTMAQEVYTSSGKTMAQAKKARQQRDKGFDITKLIVGGGATFGFTNGYTSLGLKPIVGYRLTDHFSAGVGIGYQYLHQSDVFYLPNLANPNLDDYYSLNFNIFSATAWTRYRVYKNFFIQGEYENNLTFYKQPRYESDANSPYGYKLAYQSHTDNIPCLFIGPGVRFGEPDKFSYMIMLLFDVLPQNNGLFKLYPSNYDMRIGININY